MPYAAPASAPCSFALSEVMNLIVGVLVEVVGVVAAAEQEASTRNAIFEALQEARTGFFPLHRTVACEPSECVFAGEALERLGPRKKEDVIARGEFAALVNRPDLVGIFLESGIDVVAILRDPAACPKTGIGLHPHILDPIALFCLRTWSLQEKRR